MALEYTSNIQIVDLTLTLNPGQYSHEFTKYGSFKRTCGGGIIDVDVNGERLIVSVQGIAQAQIEAIKRRASLRKIVDFIDFVPIAEYSQRTRTVHEDLGSETIDSETVYLYIPSYRIVVTGFVEDYSNNALTYTLKGEEV
ncbi:MAG TPA: hypothetical protein VMW36_10850 [Patescibacteria group bacterium]|nr:hypothetical protein [Patescibacteria group bacterium]